WIPTFVGMTECRFVGMTGFEIAAFIGKNRNRSTVIPAQAGIQTVGHLQRFAKKRFTVISVQS
ncbi:hypothetical protein, partial [Neisseria meningitidis]|uniref:hypothetical protein n=1 Tax=Neisseria meningitidis TaxID=487 RepID=UPI001981C016